MKNKFKEWIDTVPVGKYPDIRKSIIDECMVSDRVFAFWKSGRTKIPHLARPIIEKIAGRKIF